MTRLSTLRKLVHTTRDIDCPRCDGRGEISHSRPGGTWNPYVGTWEPDEWGEPCTACGQTGDTEVEWCPACDDLVERDGSCLCDEDDLAKYIADRIAEKPDAVREYERRMYHIGEDGWGSSVRLNAETSAAEHLAHLDGDDEHQRRMRLAVAVMEYDVMVHTAPDEVVHRRVDGRTVIGRRLQHRRTTNPPLEETP